MQVHAAIVVIEALAWWALAFCLGMSMLELGAYRRSEPLRLNLKEQIGEIRRVVRKLAA